MRAPKVDPKRIENLLDCPSDPHCAVAGTSGSDERAPFPEGFGDREKLAASGWVYCVACNCAVLR